MPLIRADRIKEDATNFSDDVFDLSGAVDAYRPFVDALADGDTTDVLIIHGDNWEIVRVTYDAGDNRLTRDDPPHSSSNGGAQVNFSALGGTHEISLVLPASVFTGIEQKTPSVFSQQAWVPEDGSPAGLVFPFAVGVTSQIGNLIVINFAIQFPTTADVNQAIIQGLPYAFVDNEVVEQGAITICSNTAVRHTNLIRNSGQIMFTLDTLITASNADLSDAYITATFVIVNIEP